MQKVKNDLTNNQVAESSSGPVKFKARFSDIIEVAGVIEEPDEDLFLSITQLTREAGVTLKEYDVEYVYRIGPHSDDKSCPRPIALKLRRSSFNKTITDAAKIHGIFSEVTGKEDILIFGKENGPLKEKQFEFKYKQNINSKVSSTPHDYSTTPNKEGSRKPSESNIAEFKNSDNEAASTTQVDINLIKKQSDILYCETELFEFNNVGSKVNSASQFDLSKSIWSNKLQNIDSEIASTSQVDTLNKNKEGCMSLNKTKPKELQKVNSTPQISATSPQINHCETVFQRKNKAFDVQVTHKIPNEIEKNGCENTSLSPAGIKIRNNEVSISLRETEESPLSGENEPRQLRNVVGKIASSAQVDFLTPHKEENNLMHARPKESVSKDKVTPKIGGYNGTGSPACISEDRKKETSTTLRCDSSPVTQRERDTAACIIPHCNSESVHGGAIRKVTATLRGNRSPSISAEDSEEPNCAICLGHCQNKAHTDTCRHSFCFSCLTQWSEEKKECPLCKRSFKSIIYNVRADGQHDEYIVDQTGTELPTEYSRISPAPYVPWPYQEPGPLNSSFQNSNIYLTPTRPRALETQEPRFPQPAEVLGNGYVCDVCNRVCKSGAGLASHYRAHARRGETVHWRGSAGTLYRPVQNSNIYLTPTRPRALETQEPRFPQPAEVLGNGYVCDVCNRVCKSGAGLASHYRAHAR